MTVMHVPSLFLGYTYLQTLFSNTSDHATNWLQEKTLAWPNKPAVNKIDTHHHFVPSFYSQAVASAGGDPSGWPTPKWSPLRSELLMDRLGIQTAILSVTAPGPCILQGNESYHLARQLNLYASNLRDQFPLRYGFFASLPSLLDKDAALAEIDYALDVLHADGVVIFTRYSESGKSVYLGSPSLEPIWAELNRRKAVVFVHPTHPADTTKVSPKMPQPMIDYPHETTRAAMDMILHGTRSKYPDCKVILSHAGGTLPYLIGRVATPLGKTPDFAASFVLGTTREKALADFRSFYYDLALSSSQSVLDMLLANVPRDHILHGSDFPYAPAPAYPAFLEGLENYQMDGQLRDMINFQNAVKLIPRLAASSDSE